MAKIAVVLAVLAVLLVQQGVQAKNATFIWKLGGAPGPYSTAAAPIVLCPGDLAIFTWNEGIPHNVLNTTNTAADTICTGGTLRVPTAPAGNYTVNATARGAAIFGIYCGVGSHCQGGMNAVIEIKASCPTPTP